MKLASLIVLRIVLSLSSLLASIYLSNQYGIIDNGKYFEIFKYSQVIALISVLGFPSLIIRGSNSLRLLDSLEIIVLLFSILIWTVLVCIKDLNFFESIVVLNISIIGSGFKLYESYLVTRNMQLKATFSSLSTVHIGFLIFMIIFTKVNWLILLVTFSSILVLIYTAYIFFSFQRRLEAIRNLIKGPKMFVSSLKIFTSKVNTIVMNHADTLFLFTLLSGEQLGVYAIIQRSLSIGINFMTSVRTYFTPKFKALLTRKLNEEFYALYRRVNSFVALFTFLGLCAFYLSLDSVLNLIFNTKNYFSYLQVILLSLPLLFNNSFGLVGLRLVLNFKERLLLQANVRGLLLFLLMVLMVSVFSLMTIEAYLLIVSFYALILNYLKMRYDKVS